MLIGQVMLSSPVFLPELLGWWHGARCFEGLHDLGTPLGRCGIRAPSMQRSHITARCSTPGRSPLADASIPRASVGFFARSSAWCSAMPS
jgi:hypothetical protein